MKSFVKGIWIWNYVEYGSVLPKFIFKLLDTYFYCLPQVLCASSLKYIFEDCVQKIRL